ncbi:MAG: DUF1080 domain-containing protein [Planctomycetaceae bacterium]|nr:DUF1080 domain-containing protein [Planctomycetaceae bacterium]
MHRFLAHLVIWGTVFTLIQNPECLWSQEPVETLDPQQAGEDFRFQGEYRGEVQTDDGPLPLGLQVIALGKGNFEAKAYTGGLPGAGWDGEEVLSAKGTLSDGKVTITAKQGSAVLSNGQAVVSNPDGQVVGTLNQIVRKSPTLGAKPPENAIVLFDGTSAEQFENGKLSPEGWLIQGTKTKLKMGSVQLHLEFLLPFKPEARGQGRGNSGCYLQSRYEVQVLDSFGLEGKNNECGGIYSVKAPDLNMCFQPLSWQTYDIDFTAATFDESGKKTADARMTVKHNGVLIHHNVAVPKSTTASPLKEGPEPGPLYLQDHGNPVRYRNIWIVPQED